jgi:hypothetical protein
VRAEPSPGADWKKPKAERGRAALVLPALVMDRYWNVLMTNSSAPCFFNSFIDISTRKGPRNMLHLMFDPEGMRPFVENWDAVASSLIYRVNCEATGRVVDEKTKELLAALLAYPDGRTGRPSLTNRSHSRSTQKFLRQGNQSNTAFGSTPILPIIPISFRKGGNLLNYFSMVTTVGTPQTVAAQELRIESMFPADEETEREQSSLPCRRGGKCLFVDVWPRHRCR